MEKVIKVGEKEVKFKSTAGTMARYRMYFNRDFLKDLVALNKKLAKVKDKNTDTQFETLELDIFEKIAWAMAKTADDKIPSIEYWLDDFETFSIMQILPEIVELMTSNMQGQVEAKKKLEQVAGS